MLFKILDLTLKLPESRDFEDKIFIVTSITTLQCSRRIVNVTVEIHRLKSQIIVKSHSLGHVIGKADNCRSKN